MTGSELSLVTADSRLDIERARVYLAKCVSVDEVREVKDQAIAVAAYLRQRGAAGDIAIDAAIIARRAERRLGELLRDAPKDLGGRPPETGNNVLPVIPTLADHGVSKVQSSRWQALADVPEALFDATLAECAEQKRAPTYAGMARLAKQDSESPESPEPFHVLIALGVLREALTRVIDKARAEWPVSSHHAIAHLLRKMAKETDAKSDVS